MLAIRRRADINRSDFVNLVVQAQDSDVTLTAH